VKKIYIFTLHRTLNVGAVLQAYALKATLENLCEHKIEIVDYFNDTINSRDYKLLSTYNFKVAVRTFVTFPFNYVKKRKFVQFINKYLIAANQTKYDKNNVKTIEDYDLFIAGSDQVWNFEITGKDSTFFLDFVSDKNKKASYAASFGFESNFIENKEPFINYLKDFKEISLRENIGYDEIASRIMRPHIHLDPALLPDASEWLRFTENIGEKYILVYNILPPNNLYEHAKKLSRQKNIKMLEISGLRAFFRNCGSRKIMTASPEEFLSLVANAEYVFTTSFHGTVFSILFKKRFFTELNCKGKYNHRVENLLKILGLEDRAIENFNGDYDKETDWEAVDQKLNAERQKSFDYLKRITDI
jgi:hypothetical protein